MKVILIVISTWPNASFSISQQFDDNVSCIRAAQKIEQTLGDYTNLNMCIIQDTGTIQNFE